jgi:hypothetical protein
LLHATKLQEAVTDVEFPRINLYPTARLLPFGNYRQSFNYVIGENGSRAWCHLRTNKLALLLRFIALRLRTAQGITYCLQTPLKVTSWLSGREIDCNGCL